jgi:hypothetical protein
MIRLCMDMDMYDQVVMYAPSISFFQFMMCAPSISFIQFVMYARSMSFFQFMMYAPYKGSCQYCNQFYNLI